MQAGKPLLRTAAVVGLTLGIATAGFSLPAQANPFAPTEANAASCSAFKRAKVVSKRELHTVVATGTLENKTSKTSTMVLDRTVSETRQTSTEYRADWKLFGDALKIGVSNTVTNGTTVSGSQQARVEVAAHTKVVVTGAAVSWWVKTEVTERDSKCKYKNRFVEGEVASSQDLYWKAEPRR